MPTSPVTTYLREIERQLVTGLSTEHTHRAALQRLIESRKRGIVATNEPARSACGAPDFIVTDAQNAIGYIEAKDIGKNLDEAERSEQLKRYLDGLPNLILTDYLEFRLYQSGRFVMEARLARHGPDGELGADRTGQNRFDELLQAFFSASFPVVGTPHDLAERMAATARILRDVIERAFEQEGERSTLHGQLDAFRKVLLHDLEPAQFADMYAQTICYGLFAARCNHKESRGRFTREAAIYELPETNPFLRQMFGHIAGPGLDVRLSWAVDHLTQQLDRADMNEILRDFGKRTRQEDPVVHFYETFLAAYDSSLRETRGVYYTPEPVVSYIVRSVDKILRKDFGIRDGLASTEKVPVYETHLANGAPGPRRKKVGDIHRVLILDPATGAGTFLYSVVDLIHEFIKRRGEGLWNSYVPQHLLPRLFGFELLMAPYAVAHMKLGIQLAEMGYSFQSGERLRVYLTNTLEEAFALGDLPLFANLIAEEANAAGQVKTKHPVMVVLGNPPYSGHSVNNSEWIAGLLRGVDRTSKARTGSYFEVDGEPLGERNPKWLNDDYVKFIRFAQWRIERTGYGVLAFISNNGYLDNPTFRGMRQCLMNTFDEIYLLDLHGNTKKKEKTPDGSKDENVFDIQQGVAIGIFVKHKREKKKEAVVVNHADLWGVREVWEHEPNEEPQLIGGKYAVLNQDDVETTAWTRLQPTRPFYLFVPQDGQLRAEYETLWSLPQIMPVNSVGIVTARDRLAIGWTEEETLNRVREFAGLDIETARDRFKLGPDARDWKVSLAQEDVRDSGIDKRRVHPVLYRPFDMRFTYYTGRTRGFICMPRPEVMRHMLADDNLGLMSTRLTKDMWDAHCTKQIVAHKALSAYDITYLFPLYLYPKAADEIDDIEEFVVREESAQYGIRRKPNLAPEFIADLSRRMKLDFVEEGTGDLKKTFGPEDVFHCIYAVFHSSAYRERYAEFLKMDFPRVPLTSKKGLFQELCRLGRELTAAHLLEKANGLNIIFRGRADNVVRHVRYVDTKRVYINDTQWFEDIPAAVWDFHIGGYQVCHKWLKDRQGRALTYDEITHYLKMVSALTETIEIMCGIDEIIDESGGWPIS